MIQFDNVVIVQYRCFASFCTEISFLQYHWCVILVASMALDLCSQQFCSCCVRYLSAVHYISVTLGVNSGTIKQGGCAKCILC